MQIFGHPQGALYLSLCGGPILGMHTPNELGLISDRVA